MTDTKFTHQFQVFEDYFNEILISNNAEQISPYLASDWVLLEPEFGIISKDQFINAIESGKLSHSSMKKEVVRVQIADNIALSTSRGRNVGMYQDKPFNSEHWVTNIYKKEGAHWICIMTQEAPVICK